MLRGKVVCLALLALAATGTSLAQQQNSQVAHDLEIQQRQQAYMRSEATLNDRQAEYDQRAIKAMNDLPKVRAHLTQVWQHFGMSAKDAEIVASAYRVKGINLGRGSLLTGKSDQEAASMLQSALQNKDYALADELMIGYERTRIGPLAGK
jgi:tRNA U34 5-carboxymethylaminomethyl modifying enzyme MnmG/GidA